MTAATKQPGELMAAEIAEAAGTFVKAVTADHCVPRSVVVTDNIRAMYTVARGSSDAVANIISYEAMRELGIPMTSLPPSVFSVYQGVAMEGTLTLVISQSGASPDLISCARGAGQRGGRVLAIVNKPDSAIEAVADATLAIQAGPELAVPATKSVTASIATGMALIALFKPDYQRVCLTAAEQMSRISGNKLAQIDRLHHALLKARHVYVVGRGAGFGAAYEIALKIKETCAIHAEAYSASEVLHGPLQLATKPLCVLILDTGEMRHNASLDRAETRFGMPGVDLHRIHPSDAGAGQTVPAAAAAILLYLLYPVILATALALGHNPDKPETLSKETATI